MDLLSSLNSEQRAAVEHVDGALLILAGAGSGKTRVIAHRVAHLVQERHAGLDQVLAVTFTNKAAEEMRERVGKLLEADCRSMWISTFHSLCARLLRREAHHLGLSRNFTIYDSGDQQSVVKQLIKEYQLDDSMYQPRMVLSRISHAKNRMEGPETFVDGWNPKDREIGRLYAGYLKALTDASALDFDDLLLKAVELFDKAPDVRQRYAHRLKFAMIDEYQDTNRPQYLLVKQLVSVHANLCVVGDPDQSIYKWRGADVKNILDFKRDFPDAMVVKLERNYRSTQVILDAASAVVSRNSGREDKRLWTDQAGGAPIVTYRGADELDEADFIVKVIRKALEADYNTTAAVLYRTNAQSRAVEDGLRMAGIHYAVLGGTGFYERKEIKDALSYLKLVLNPHDDVALRRVINVPPRGIGKGVMDALERVDTSHARRAHAAAAGRTRADRGVQHAVGEDRSGGHARVAVVAADGAAGGFSRDDHRRHGGGRHRPGVDGARPSARPLRLPARPARGTQRRGRWPHREPDGTRVGSAPVRDGGARRGPGRVRRPPGAALGRGQARGQQARPGAADDDALGQGTRVSSGRDCRS